MANLKLYKYTLLVVAFGLFSCSPQKKLHRLLKKHPELKETQIVRVKDTVHVVIPETRIDTVLSIQELIKDTIILEKEYLKAKFYIKNDSLHMVLKHDTIYKTIIREIPVKVDKIVYRRPRDCLRTIIISMFILMFFLMLLFTDWKKINK
jgi:hypothetical protein